SELINKTRESPGSCPSKPRRPAGRFYLVLGARASGQYHFAPAGASVVAGSWLIIRGGGTIRCRLLFGTLRESLNSQCSIYTRRYGKRFGMKLCKTQFSSAPVLGSKRARSCG